MHAAQSLQKKKRKTTTICGTSASTNCTDNKNIAPFLILEDTGNVDLLKHILSFVGDHHYRFVGGVNRSFQKAYITLFPLKLTYLNASSIPFTKLCWDDIKITLRYYFEKKDECRSILWRSAAKYGNKDVVKYLHRLIRSRDKPNCDPWQIDWRYDLAFKAAEYGHLQLLQWACDQKVYISKFDTRVCKYAIGGGNFQLFHWAFEYGFVWDTDYIVDSAHIATQKGQLNVLKWMHSTGYDFDEYDDDYDEGTVWCDIAVEFGQYEVLEWFHSIGSQWGDNSIDCAIKFGRLEALEYMLHDGCRGYSVGSCKLAAISGNLEALQLLRSVDCEWDDTVPAFAAGRGHVHLIEWAINNGCPWSERTCLHAAAYGTLETLKWLRAKGCPWDDKTTEHASTNEIYLWAKGNGCPVAKGNPRNGLVSDYNFYL
jgi:hypothetical protein